MIKHVVCNSAGQQLQRSPKKLMSERFQWHTTVEEREGRANIWGWCFPCSWHIPLCCKGTPSSDSPEVPVCIPQAGALHRDACFACSPFSPSPSLPAFVTPPAGGSPASDLPATGQGVSPPGVLEVPLVSGIDGNSHFRHFSSSAEGSRKIHNQEKEKDYWADSQHGVAVSFIELLFRISSAWLLFEILKSVSKHLALLRLVSCQ